MRIVAAAALPFALCAMVGLARAADPDPLPEPITAGSPERIELERIVQAARAEGLPHEILLAKIREGVAKHVPPARLVEVARTLAQRLHDALVLARASYGGISAVPGTTNELVLCRALLDARAVGLEAAELSAILRNSPSAGIAVSALQATTDLVARGFPKDSTLRTVLAVVRRQPSALDSLAADVERARDRGASALEALQLGGNDALRGNNGKKSNAAAGDNGNGDPNPNSETRGPDRETIGSRGKALGNGNGKGKGGNKP